MIRRHLLSKLLEISGHYPVSLVVGPRQSGKTTLCRSAYPDRRYVSLEALDVREYARSDPRGFLAEFSSGAIFDEIQTVPELFNYLQPEVDERPQCGRFILTGSQNLALSQAVSQSLAGRCGILTLLPPSYDELCAFPTAPQDLFTALWQGAYPRIYDQRIPAAQWLADYLATYVQRDVRQLLNVGDLHSFTNFLRLCAGRTAQEINLSALGADAGISYNTARAWLTVLEASYIVLRLPAWHANVRKQIVKAPKLHFLDSGLACHLLGIRDPEQLRHHPCRGALFESWVVTEIYKSLLHAGVFPNLYHYREARGVEVDLIIDTGTGLIAAECKSGETLPGDALSRLLSFSQRLSAAKESPLVTPVLIYGGVQSQQRTQAQVYSWKDAYQVAALTRSN